MLTASIFSLLAVIISLITPISLVVIATFAYKTKSNSDILIEQQKEIITLLKKED